MNDSTESHAKEPLEDIAMLALEFGRLVMEAGGSARHVEEIASQVAFGLGAERMDMRVGYASLAITVGRGLVEITRMRQVGALGVNQSLDHKLRAAAKQIERGGCTMAEARAELEELLQTSSRHPAWFVALSVGVACAAFGRLLGVDWAGVGPIFVAAAIGQWVRSQLTLRKVNGFVSATAVAFLSSTLAGLGGRWAASQTVTLGMVAAILLLVPGVPAINAQYDILEGHPTLGSARAVWVTVILIFTAVGVWFAQGLLGEGR
jgi:uncharacterized membrane protein YjjP (DUF1212 family)